MGQVDDHGWKSLEAFANQVPIEAKLNLSTQMSHSEIKKFVLHTAAKKTGPSPVHYFEFGVFRAGTFNYVQNLFFEGSTYVGFDSFYGLPEAWTTHMPFHRTHKEYGYTPTAEQSHNGFSLNGQVPEPGHGTLVKGLFQETIEPYFKSFDRKFKSVMLVDCDLYSSTLFLLTRLHSYFAIGDLIIFDEFGDSLNEFRAFNDYVGSHHNTRSFECFAYDNVDGLVVGFEKIK